jgi:hypothetical protein
MSGSEYRAKLLKQCDRLIDYALDVGCDRVADEILPLRHELANAVQVDIFAAEVRRLDLAEKAAA